MSNIVRFPGAAAGRRTATTAGVAEPPRRLAWIGSSLARRRWPIIAAVVVAPLFAAVGAGQLTPQYSARSELVIEAPRDGALDPGLLAGGWHPDFVTVETEARIVASRVLGRQAVAALDLLGRPEFNIAPTAAAASPFDRLAQAVQWGADLLLGGRAPADEAVPLSPELLLERATDAYLARLSVTAADRARTIAITFRSSDPVLAAVAANAAARLYLQDRQRRADAAGERASAWLDASIAGLRDRVADSERRLAEFRQSSGPVDAGGAALLHQQIAQASARLVEARTARAEADARAARMRRMLESAGDSVEAVLDSPLIVHLRLAELALRRQIAELGIVFREGHPKLAQARSELAELRRSMRAEAERIAMSLSGESQAARVREASLEGELAELQRQLDEQTDSEAVLRRLESEARTDGQLVEALAWRLREIDALRSGSPGPPEARIISVATPPQTPQFPRLDVIVPGAALVAIAVAVLVVLVLELSVPGYRTARQVERELGLPVLGVVPEEPVSRRRGHPLHRHAAERSGLAFPDALRRLRGRLALVGDRHACTVLAVVSALPGEGKTTIVLSLAHLAARAGQRVLVVEGDFAAPEVSRRLGLPAARGLAEVLAGKATLEDAVEFDETTGCHVLVAGRTDAAPGQILRDPRLDAALAKARAGYDLVLIDAPAIEADPEALLLARRAGCAVLVVRAGRTARESAAHALDTLLQAGVEVAGIVLSRADLTSLGRSPPRAAGVTRRAAPDERVAGT